MLHLKKVLFGTAIAVAVAGAAHGQGAGGLAPSDVVDAYQLTPAASNRTVVIIGAWGYATAESDLGSFRSTFGLGACTTANGCFKVVNENGTTSLPPANIDPTFSATQALKLDMVSAACPTCKITLMEQRGTTDALFQAAMTKAFELGDVIDVGVTVSPTSTVIPAIEAQLSAHAAIRVLAPSGATYPGTSSSLQVIRSAGTLLTADSSPRGWHETIDPTSRSGSAGADVAAVDAGVLVEDATGLHVQSGQALATSIMAGRLALQSGSALPTRTQVRAATARYFDIAVGTDADGHTAASGIDMASGIGSPKGNASF